MWGDRYFGGNGSSPDNCVTTGPFGNRTEHIGPLELTTDYCFARKWNMTKGLDYGARSHVDDCYEYGGDEFESYFGCMAYYPHIAGHQATGGVMADVDSSPGDPVFYLHHNYLDRLYWQWQQINATERLHLIKGNTTVTESPTGWAPLTLDYEMEMYGTTDNVAIGDVTNIQGGFLCYSFEY
jgi:tyrosinase